jgi:hypothetical protein
MHPLMLINTDERVGEYWSIRHLGNDILAITQA